MSENRWYLYSDGDRSVPPNVSHLLIACNVLDIPSSICAGHQCLREIRFQPNSVCRGIGASAFFDCPSLEFVELSPTVRLIGFMAFQNCRRLRVVKMDTMCQPQAITTRRKFGLGFQCFKNASSLTEVSIAEGIRSISEACFEGCSSLRRISLPNTVEHLMKKAFKSCTNLEIALLNQGLRSISDEAFAHCEKLGAMPIPCSVERIGTRAFASCTNLEIVGLDYGLKSIAEEAFAHCENLRAVPIPNSVERIGTRAFASCTNLETVGLKCGLKAIDEEAFAHCDNLRTVPIPNSVERIGSRVFENCKRLYSIEVKNASRLWIGDDIFRGCSNLIWIVVSFPTCKRYYNRFHFLADAFDQCPAIDSSRDQKTVFKTAADRFDSLQWYSTSYNTCHAHDKIEMAKLDEMIQKYHQEQQVLPSQTLVDGINLFHIMASSTFPRHNPFHTHLDSLPLRLLFQEDKIGLSPLMLLADNPSPEAHDLLVSLIPKLAAFSSTQ
mmetsp:Transcript_35181/g.85230  ORF Transcript_35181/g.85230 Transcript_35181/m.85230 type:complete len:496 (+) Transcript_35181:69-1556(+)